MDTFTEVLNWSGGTITGLAKKMGVSPAAVCKWREKGIPAERCREIERLSGGQLTRAQLRPDIFGPIDEVA